ncbi:MAG: glucuronate isomerase [Clostridiaceae bacterium]|nr:glucuronate isomerase [Clostridiaceae bacterium]
MLKFMDEDFLLQSKTARNLYHNDAKGMPIIDYHCHLNPKEIAENKRYRNITELWLGGDHYKWRVIRANGVEEKYITGDADDKAKFMKWAGTMPYLIGNPLYHWTHLELKRYFNIDSILSPATAEEIWNQCNEMLQGDDFSARGLILRSNVEVICTTDDPADTLEYHKAIKNDPTFPVGVYPTFRPDKALNLDMPGFTEYIGRLEQATGITISSVAALKEALQSRMDYFHDNGCRISDHGLEYAIYAEATDEEVENIFRLAIDGNKVTRADADRYKTKMLVFLGREYAKRSWAMQLHVGTIRNNNSRMYSILGPDTGFDAIGDSHQAKSLAAFLDALDSTSQLPKTILYSLNPKDNETLATIMGCFQGTEVPGKIQLGSGWWFNDQKDGMEKQMIALANVGLLRRFVGMLTDSRSFLSFTRHEYFRRILCNIIGNWAEQGEVNTDLQMLGDMVREISYYNAKNYFAL